MGIVGHTSFLLLDSGSGLILFSRCRSWQTYLSLHIGLLLLVPVEEADVELFVDAA